MRDLNTYLSADDLANGRVEAILGRIRDQVTYLEGHRAEALAQQAVLANGTYHDHHGESVRRAKDRVLAEVALRQCREMIEVLTQENASEAERLRELRAWLDHEVERLLDGRWEGRSTCAMANLHTQWEALARGKVIKWGLGMLAWLDRHEERRRHHEAVAATMAATIGTLDGQPVTLLRHVDLLVELEEARLINTSLLELRDLCGRLKYGCVTYRGQAKVRLISEMMANYRRHLAIQVDKAVRDAA